MSQGGRPKISVALPLWKFMYAESVSNYAALILGLSSRGLLYSIQTTMNLFVDEAREAMTMEFMSTKATHMFCLDSDMGIPLYGVERLLSHSLPIVGGLYVSRRNEHFPFIWEEMHTPNGRFLDYKVAVDWPKGSLVECDVTGAGCLLIERSVFEAFGPPWWMRTLEPGGTDIAFLRRAKQAGYKVYVDTSVDCAHYHVSALHIQNFYDWRDNRRDDEEYPIFEEGT